MYGSHSYLPTQFLSPRTNRRSDAYGGSFENRARFWLEAIERVREAIGDRCAIAVRVAADSFAATGIEPDEGAAFVRAADGLVDLWDAAIGAEAGEHRTDSGASRAYPQGYQLELTRWMRGATAKPMIGVGRYTDPDLMAAHVASGALDVIGAARPSIADPFLPAKIRDGRYDEIRECIGCNQCYSRANYARHLGCTQNATAGEEHRRGWHPERFEPAANAAKDVLVVGAGPAGLECAIVLARRGFKRVHLVDAAPEIGGHLRWLPQLPGLGDWARVLDWRRIQLRKLRRQIEVITGEELTADDVRGYGAELVVIATGLVVGGGRVQRARRRLGGAGDARVVTPERVLDGLPDGDVAVIDCEGYLVGAGLRRAGAAAAAAGSRTTRRSTGSGRCSTRRSRRACCGRSWPRPGWSRRRCRRAWRSSTRARSCWSRSARSDDALYHALTEDPGRRRGRLPGRRLRRAPDPGGRDLRRAPAGARDRHARIPRCRGRGCGSVCRACADVRIATNARKGARHRDCHRVKTLLGQACPRSRQ